MPTRQFPAFSVEQAQWVQGAVSILVGTCGPLHRPHVGRAVGCCVQDEGRRVSILLQASTAPRTLDDLHVDDRIAVVFCEPTGSRSLQVKGRCSRLGPAGQAGLELSHLWVTRFARGLTESVSGAWTPQMVSRVFVTGVPDDLVAVEFQVQALFDQSPGPRAGEAIVAGEP